MSYRVFTTFSAKDYYVYGQDFISTFNRYWPKDIELVVYFEETPPATYSDRVIWKDYHKSIPEQKKYLDRNKHRKSDKFAHTYDRFSYKAFTIIKELKDPQVRNLIWLDADILTLNWIPEEWLQKLHPSPKYVSALLRKNIWAETGYLCFDTAHKYHQEFIDKYASMYEQDHLFLLEGWTDSHVFSAVIDETKVKNLSGPEPWHPFVTGPLGQYMDHLKGKRKQLKQSPERAKYWK